MGRMMKGRGTFRLKVGFQPVKLKSPTASRIRWCMQVYDLLRSDKQRQLTFDYAFAPFAVLKDCSHKCLLNGTKRKIRAKNPNKDGGVHRVFL